MQLQLDRLSKHYGSKIAVDRVSTTFEPGIYGLLGANGSGKTTLMRMICGVLRSTSGEILLNGNPTDSLGASYRDLLGYLPQDFGYYPDFKALDFLLYIAALKGLDKKQAKRLCMKALHEVGLEDCVKNKIKTFSGGMKQRLGIAQAVINNPKILILDEPTAGLDPQERVRFRNLISNLSQDRIVILSTHIVSDVEYIAGKILVMKQGSFILEGSPTKLEEEIEGKVWEMEIAPQEVDALSTQLCIANINHTGTDTALVRVVADERPRMSAQAVKPTLEDLYLYLFDSEQHAVLTYNNITNPSSASQTKGGDHG